LVKSGTTIKEKTNLVENSRVSRTGENDARTTEFHDKEFTRATALLQTTDQTDLELKREAIKARGKGTTNEDKNGREKETLTVSRAAKKLAASTKNHLPF
jgi:hypothetical protein